MVQNWANLIVESLFFFSLENELGNRERNTLRSASMEQYYSVEI